MKKQHINEVEIDVEIVAAAHHDRRHTTETTTVAVK